MLDGKRILLVEDDEVDRQRVHRAVRKAGLDLEIVDAGDVTAGCEALAEERFDCAVIDFNLPDGNALDLLAFVAGAGDNDVPVVVLTGEDDDRLAIEALHAGAEDYLVKNNFEIDSFLRALRYAIERHRLRRDLETTNQRLQRELEIGGNIQTSILPRDLDAEGLDIAARMVPATEVGGDYYDVISESWGCWLAVGDVAGHGMGAAIVALMTQSSIAGLTRAKPNARPSEIIALTNEVLYHNIRERLGQDEHVTLTLMRYEHGGRLLHAGAHEELLLFRAAKGACEIIMTPGTWLGARRDIRAVTSDSEVWLDPGDVLVLYTDGITEAMNDKGEQYGLERLVAALEQTCDEPSVAIHARIWADVRRWTATQEDDVTLLVIRRVT
jgi:serine phosphatase RsbU (regulator of sigma subunit)